MLAPHPPPLDLDRALAKARAAGRRSHWLVVDACALLLLGIPGFLLSLASGVVIATGAVVLILWACVLRSHRDELISRLAVHREAYHSPAVAAYGAKASSRKQLELLSTWLREIVDNSTEQHSLCATPRAWTYRSEIAALADELASPDRMIPPEAAVECRRLLTRSVESPLYNQEVPEEDLRATIFRIRDGISTMAGK